MMVCLILTHNVIRIYHKSCWRQLSYCGLHVRAVPVFGKKSDSVFGFLAYFCAVFRFLDPPYAALLNERDSVIVKLSSEVRMQVQISIEYSVSWLLIRGKKVCMIMIQWSRTAIQWGNLNKICINFRIHAQLIIESNHLFVDFSVYVYLLRKLFLTKVYFLSTYLVSEKRTYLVSEKLTSVVAASVFVGSRTLQSLRPKRLILYTIKSCCGL